MAEETAGRPWLGVGMVATGTDPAPSFADGPRVQRVLAAVERSAARESAWTPVLMS